MIKTTSNPVVYFEIPVTDLDRAVIFMKKYWVTRKSAPPLMVTKWQCFLMTTTDLAYLVR